MHETENVTLSSSGSDWLTLVTRNLTDERLWPLAPVALTATTLPTETPGASIQVKSSVCSANNP